MGLPVLRCAKPRELILRERRTDTRQPPVSPEASDEDAPAAPHQWDAQGDAPFYQDLELGSPSGSATDTEDKDDSNDGPSLPIQKRRRVTRACDECRRKKIKCDGKQPCTHCSVYSYGRQASPSTPHSLLERGWRRAAQRRAFEKGTDTSQIALTISHQIDGETPRPNTSKRWRAASSAPRRCSASSCPMLTSPTPASTQP